jgi:hypothetical protein
MFFLTEFNVYNLLFKILILGIYAAMILISNRKLLKRVLSTIFQKNKKQDLKDSLANIYDE